MIYIWLESFNFKLLDFYLSLIKKKAKNKGFFVKSVLLPTKSKKWSVIKSPHVHSKSKEQFELRTHVRLLVIRLNNIDKLFYFENWLKLNSVSGVSLKFQYKN